MSKVGVPRVDIGWAAEEEAEHPDCPPNTWPDAATTPFRSEKYTDWEGAFRVPEMIRS